MRMKLTCYLCVANLIILGLAEAVAAFSGFNLLLFLCFNNQTVYGCFLAVCGVSALFCIYACIVFKPFKGLK